MLKGRQGRKRIPGRAAPRAAAAVLDFREVFPELRPQARAKFAPAVRRTAALQYTFDSAAVRARPLFRKSRPGPRPGFERFLSCAPDAPDAGPFAARRFFAFAGADSFFAPFFAPSEALHQSTAPLTNASRTTVMQGPEDKIFRIPVRIYWEDTDAGGIVYHANYLRFMERARSEMLRALGFEQNSMRLSGGPLIVVSKLEIAYRRPARLDDLLTVETRITSLRRASIVFDQTIRRSGEVIAEARVRCASVDPARGVPVEIPAPVREALERRLADQSCG